MIESLHFHRGYSLRLHKSKPFINYGIISLRGEEAGLKRPRVRDACEQSAQARSGPSQQHT